EIQEQLHDPEAVVRQVQLPVVDRVVPACPDMMLARLGRKLLANEVLRVHADDEHLLVVRTVEDADLPARRQPLLIAAEEVLVELEHRRDLEALDAHTLRVEAAHHVADRPVLARGIECLKHDQHAVGVLGCESRLVLRKQLDPALQEVDTVLLLLDPRLEARIEVPRQLHPRARAHPERLDQPRYSLRDVVCHIGRVDVGTAARTTRPYRDRDIEGTSARFRGHAYQISLLPTAPLRSAATNAASKAGRRRSSCTPIFRHDHEAGEVARNNPAADACGWWSICGRASAARMQGARRRAAPATIANPPNEIAGSAPA